MAKTLEDFSPTHVAIATMEAIIAGLKDGSLVFEECDTVAHCIETTTPDASAEAGTEFTKTGREVLRLQYVRADAPVFQVVFSKVGG